MKTSLKFAGMPTPPCRYGWLTTGAASGTALVGLESVVEPVWSSVYVKLMGARLPGRGQDSCSVRCIAVVEEISMQVRGGLWDRSEGRSMGHKQGPGMEGHKKEPRMVPRGALPIEA